LRKIREWVRFIFLQRGKGGKLEEKAKKEKSMRRKRSSEQTTSNHGIREGMMVLTGMKEWRQQHPKATFREIEEAVDERLARLRAGMLEDLARMSSQADWIQSPKEQRPTCEQCGTPLVSRGKQKRRLQTTGGQQVELERGYGTCPQCGQGIFPPG
jgi:RNase P subunit RPR2